MHRSIAALALLLFTLAGCGKEEHPNSEVFTAPPNTAGSTNVAANTTPSASTSPAPSSRAVDLRYITADDRLALIVHPSRAFNNALVQKVLKEIEQSNPEFQVAKAMDEMRAETGVDVSEIDSVLVTVNEQTLSMLPMLAPLLPSLLDSRVQEEPKTSFPEPSPEKDIAPPQQAPSPDKDMGCDGPQAPGEAGPGGPAPGGSGPEGPGPDALFAPPEPPLVVATFTHPVDPTKLVTQLRGETKLHGGKSYYSQPNGTALYLIDGGATAIFGSETRIQSLIDKPLGEPGPLAATIKPLADRELALVFDIRSLHGFLAQMTQGGPGPATMAAGFAQQVNTLTLNLDLQGKNLLELNLDAASPDAAKGIHGMLSGLLESGKQSYAQHIAEEAPRMKPHEKALQPLMDSFVSGATLAMDGTACRFTVARPQGLDQLPELIRPLLAEAQKARETARRMNPLRELTLAFHVFESLHRHFPTAGGPGLEGQPGNGLSWRVHLLPFLEQQSLYNEFHLDEPWDSEHNKTLIPLMPALFGKHPEGKTSIHVFVGEGTPLGGERGLEMSDIVDGTSNTILIVEAGPSTADIWTKPGGLAFDPADPLKSLGDIGDTFAASLIDGSAHALPKSIDAATLRNLIQYNDGNPVHLP